MGNLHCDKEKIDAAFDLATSLFNQGRLDRSEYGVLRDGIDANAEQDRKVEALWKEFQTVVIDPKTDRLQTPFLIWPVGSPRDKVLGWFEREYSRGVDALITNVADQFPDLAELNARRKMCYECMSETCVFCPDGICMFPMVAGREPLTSEEGCSDWLCYGI